MVQLCSDLRSEIYTLTGLHAYKLDISRVQVDGQETTFHQRAILVEEPPASETLSGVPHFESLLSRNSLSLCMIICMQNKYGIDFAVSKACTRRCGEGMERGSGGGGREVEDGFHVQPHWLP